MYSVKIPVANFRLQVLFGPLQADKRDAGFQQNLFPVFGGKFSEKTQVLSFHLLYIAEYRCLGNKRLILRTSHLFSFTDTRIRDFGTPNPRIDKRLTELGIKVDGIIRFSVTVSPSASFRSAFHPSPDCMVVHHLDKLVG
ncbi:hypothetical protein DSECCO2_528410 [anaerobic digester metagenome]